VSKPKEHFDSTGKPFHLKFKRKRPFNNQSVNLLTSQICLSIQALSTPFSTAGSRISPGIGKEVLSEVFGGQHKETASGVRNRHSGQVKRDPESMKRLALSHSLKWR
jgi:hypothetical protein